VSYQDLFEQKRYAEAIEELQRELELEPNDKKRSLLAVCWFILGKSRDALRILQQIEYPTNLDYEIWADIHWQSENWNEMAIALRSAQRISPSAYTYYRLALVEGKGRYSYEIDAASKEIMQSYLIRAIEFEECPVEAYLLLADLYELKDIESRVNTLNKAFQKYPDKAIVRLELAPTLIYRKGEYERAIVLLSPLLGTEEFDRRARWYTFEALVCQKKFADAIRCLDGILIEDESFISRIKADLLFRQGQLGEWLASSAEYMDSTNLESVIRHYFRKAYINFHRNNLKQAVSDFRSGAELFLGIDTYLDSLIGVWASVYYFSYQEFDVIADVCETLVLLKDETELLAQQDRGLLLYIIQKYFCEEQQEELLQFFPDLSESPLVSAAELLGCPPCLGYELAQEILDKNLLQAIHYYLKHAIWKCESDDYLLKSFSEKVFNEKNKPSNEDKEEVYLINNIVLPELRKCKNPDVISKVFLPFYNTIWRKLLFETNSFAIVAEVSKKFVDNSKNLEGLFDYAYSMDCIGNQDEAATTYLRLIDQQPINTAALNNLGVIYETKGMLDEAFSLFSQAVEFSPSDKIFSSNYNRLKSQINRRNQSLQSFRDAIEKVRTKAASIGFSEESLAELNKIYWESDIAVKSIQEKFDVKRYGYSSIYSFVFPYLASEKCPNCFIDLVYKNRSAKASEDKICLGCGHQSRGWCACQYCKKIQEERKQQAERARR
jgi:tetratricopeptide (TPR) repeat protein